MMIRAGCVFLTLLVGSIAFPVNEKEDINFFLEEPVTDPFIIGGSVAGPVPHMVALTTGFFIKSFHCGGSIVNDRYVLSAAHCIRAVVTAGQVLSSLRGFVGHNRWSSSSIELKFSRGINHPNYNHNTIKNDLGFLVSSSRIPFSNNVQPVALSFDFIGGDVATIANGWGRNVNGGPAAQVLMELRPFSVDGQKCIAEVARVGKELNRNTPPVDPEVELCAFFARNTGMCHGDSGSALILEDSKKQVGVVSWGVPCARGAPDMYARVSAYESWIKQQLQ